MNRTHNGGLLLMACAALLAASLTVEQARAQETAAAVASPPPEGAGAEPWTARKIDEYARVGGGCDHGARLDHLAMELQNHPEMTGYVIAYGPRGEASGTAHFRLEVMRSYFASTRGLAPERVVTVNGGVSNEKDNVLVEMWVVPPGAEPPRPRKFENDAATFSGLFAEFDTWDVTGMLGEALGPPSGNSKLAGFAEVLRLQPTARAYVVAFNGEESTFRAWQRVAAREVEALGRQGVSADRVGVIYGGQDEKLKMQLWVLPPAAPPPAAAAEPEQRPSKATALEPFESAVLKYPEDARTLYKSIAEALKADEELTATLVVNLPPPPEADEPEEAEEVQTSAASAEPGASKASEESSPEEPPDVDLLQLVEKWKGDLLKEYGIGGHRLSVIVVPHDEEGGGYTGSIVTWLVPPGAAQPDPFAEEEEAEEAEAEVTEEAAPAEEVEAVEPPDGRQFK